MTHLNKADYTVANVSLLTAQRLIAAHHYAKGSANTATFRHGLFARANPSICLGVACWLPPTKSAAQASWDGDWRRVLSLSRLVIVPEIPTNAASYLLGRSIRLMRRIDAELGPIEKEWREIGGRHWDLTSGLPEAGNVCVVTKDGLTFSVQLFSGAYSDRYEWTVDAEGEWDVCVQAYRNHLEREKAK